MPRPHPGQRAALDCGSRYRVLACGRRFGKTVYGIHRLVETALRGGKAAWFAPHYKYLDEAWREFVAVLRPLQPKVHVQTRRIELPTRGSIEFWTLDDPDAGRSRKYHRVAIDEAAKVRRLGDAWDAAIRPTLTDYKGDADFLSTPKGRDFFFRCWSRGEDPHKPEWASFRFPTTDNPRIDPAEIEAARHDVPERLYRQEYLAEFLEDAGGVFRNVAASIDRGRDLDRRVAEPGTNYAMGIDLARLEDFTVLTVVGSDGRQVYHERFNQISWERQIAAVREAARTYRPVIFADSTGVGDPIFERLVGAGLNAYPYHLTHASKTALIDNLAMALENGRLRLMDVPVQEAELSAYEYQMTAARNVRTAAPEGMHDDCVIALALAAWGATGAGVRIDDVGAY